jgi:predicted RNA-binding protein YlqC (UPF0109 family)
MAERQCDDGEGRRQLKLSVRAEEGERVLGSKGKRCGVLTLLLGVGER